MREEYDRARLLEEVWNEPVKIVSLRYGLSDVGLKKLCTRLQIPTPSRGYWTKLKAGKRLPPKPKLREYTGKPAFLFKPINALRIDHDKPEQVDEHLQVILEFERDPANRIHVPVRVTKWHPLVAATREAFKSSFIDGRGLPIPGGKGINVAVSAEIRPRALRIAHALLKALDERGYKAVTGDRYIEIEVLGQRLPLCFSESSKRSDYVPTERQLAEKSRGGWSHWPQYQYTPSGQLQVSVEGGFAGKITDGKRQLVEEQLNKLLVSMVVRATSLRNMREERTKSEEQHFRQSQEGLRLQAIQDAEKEKLGQLKTQAQNWMQADTIRAYIDVLEKRALVSGSLSKALAAHIAWARAKADWLDPLVLAPDSILDQEIFIPN